ncbi:MAG TPA: adenylate/guanylate cyclase domain-containing protein [Candidatus Limnocylindrales bacterium]
MICPDCGTPIAPGALFCHHCGRRLEALADGLKVGDRRVVTALFADLVGYTRLVDELDPEEVRARVDGALTALAEAVVHFGGTLEKFVGDAVLAVFGTPVAHDDDPLRACLCGLAMQVAIARSAVGDERPMRLRIGIATGEVVAALREVAGTRSVALTGDPMTTAARLQGLAEPDEILLDAATTTAAEPRIGVDPLGEKLLRGQRRAVPVFRLRQERLLLSHPCREAAPLIGRDAEKGRMAAILRRTAETGKGGAILLRGEPGIGKSRLLCEMEEDARAAGLAWMWLDNTPHGQGSPYRVARQMVDWLADEWGATAGVVARQLLFGDDVAPDLNPDAARLMAAAVAVLARDSEMDLLPDEGWEVGSHEGFDPDDLRLALQFTTHMWVSRMIAVKPRCIVIDDFHWIDPSSRFLMDIMIRMAGTLPMVVLTGSRPPAEPDWLDQPHVEVIDLGGLDEAATEALGTMVAGSVLETESARWLYQRTAGNALFVGEIVRTLRETGGLEQVGEGVRIDRGATRRGVPLSLRALMGARIDALPPAQRSALEVASIFGMTFSEPALLALCGEGVDRLDLGELAETGIVTGAEEPGMPPGQWRFRHQLFLDAAYGRLLVDRRRSLHGSLADLIEASDTHPDIAELARHRVAAGDTDRALPLLEQAAREAAALGAITESEAFARAATEIRNSVAPGAGLEAD